MRRRQIERFTGAAVSASDLRPTNVKADHSRRATAAVIRWHAWICTFPWRSKTERGDSAHAECRPRRSPERLLAKTKRRGVGPCRDRTYDKEIKSLLLYQLS